MSTDPLVRSHRDPLYGFSPEALRDWLASQLCGRASQAYLFGSVAAGGFGPLSDVDLMVVADTEVPFVERGALFDDLRDRVPSLEILVYTPEEFARLTANPSAGFWRSVMPTLRRIL